MEHINLTSRDVRIKLEEYSWKQNTHDSLKLCYNKEGDYDFMLAGTDYIRSTDPLHTHKELDGVSYVIYFVNTMTKEAFYIPLKGETIDMAKMEMLLFLRNLFSKKAEVLGHIDRQAKEELELLDSFIEKEKQGC